MAGCLVYLVPGFFGFTTLGALRYFHRVADILQSGLAQRGVQARVIECATLPSGSLGRRADRLLGYVVETGGLEAEALHFIGHSTGGLDVRLMMTPEVRLRSQGIEDRLGERTRTIISVATPHFGTPIANFFTSLPGRQVLRLLTMLAVSRHGRYGLFAAARALRMAARLDDLFGRDETLLDSLVNQLLGRITLDRNDPVWVFLKDLAADQGVIIQLTAETMHLFNATVTDRPGVRYSSVVTAAPVPPMHYLSREYLSMSRASMAALFSLLYLAASRMHPHYPYPPSCAQDLAACAPSFPVTPHTNDGIVPTLSQPYGRVLDVVRADHLDVIGQFHNAATGPYSDWLPSGSGFDEAQFGRVWDLVADEIAMAMAMR